MHPIFIAIESADLTRKQKGIAFALAVRSTHGYLTLSWQEIQAICECTTNGAVRAHLIAFKAAGLMYYHTNAAVRIEWNQVSVISQRAQEISHQSQEISQRAPTPADDAEINVPTDPDDQPLISGDQPPISDDQPARAGDQPLIIGGTIGGNERMKESDPPRSTKNSFIHSVRTDAQALGYVALQSPEIALSRRKASDLAGRYSLDKIRRACLRFFDEKRRPNHEAGLIVHWLDNDEPLPVAKAADMATDWWQRHSTRAERIANQPQPAEPPTVINRTRPAANDDTPAEWKRIHDELLATLPAATVEQWLLPVRCVAITADTIQIETGSALVAQFVEHRLASRIESAAARVTGRNLVVDVSTRCQEVIA